MSLPAPYSEVYYEGTGSRVEFPFGSDFNAISADYVKCIVYLEDGTPIVPTYTVDMSVGSITISALTMPDNTILTAPPVGSQVRVFRDVPEAQNVTASQLQSYTAKQLEVALDAIVAMIQEVSYTVDHKTLRLTETQRDVALQELKEANDGCLVYWDFTNRKLVVTNYPQQDVVQCVNGLFFRLRTDPDTQQPYLQWSTDNSDWHSIDVDAVRELAQSAYNLADSAYNLASTTRGELNAHKALRNNPHETSMNNLIDTNFNNLVSGQFLQFNGINWVNVDYNTTVTWGGIGGNINNQTDLKNALDAKVNLDGSSIMTGPLKMRASISFQCAIAPYWDGVGFFKLNDDNSVTLIASIDTTDGFLPWVTNTYNIGSSLKKWKNLYLGGKLFVSTINNGGDLTVPANTTGTLATKADVDLAANSGRMITDQGVWYAKMYAATVAPAAEDGTNYADFSQVDGQGNPVIVTYNRVNGAWVQDQTITPPAEYDGYVPITSKIWDITEQDGQQGGRILWNHQSKEFTPYPQIISFDNQVLNYCSLVSCTVTLPSTMTRNAAVNAGYVIDRQNWQDISDETFVATAMDIELADDKTMYFVDATADTEITIDASNISVAPGNAKTFEIHIVCGGTVPNITWQGIDNWLIDSETTPSEANATSIFVIRVQQRPSNLVPTVVANYGGAY